MKLAIAQHQINTVGVYLSVTEIRRGWGKMIKIVKSGHPVFVLRNGRHVATLEPQNHESTGGLQLHGKK
jgi:antitoxin (DNA-binding transcriptional repressor) of toxin-antitoxin stability system